ncbi:unnamed protein product [Calicophoron daubneyi]|uniref:Peptidase aspartic putative domain-containing protein n=1 Tax=Calicophoron daubneyi TaxID=300641 RepID=A0AAV2T565_CALDB
MDTSKPLPLHLCNEVGARSDVETVAGQLETELLREECELEERELQLLRKRHELRKRSLMYDGRQNQARTGYVGSGTIRRGSFLPDSKVPSDTVREVQETFKSLLIRLELPKVEVEKFDGTPWKFYRFLKIFETSIAQRISSDQQRLSLLIQHCTGLTKQSIEHCVMLTDGCYDEAVQTLRTRFGRPHQIVESLTDPLFNGPKLVETDVGALQRLTTEMRSCELTLQQLGKASELNSSVNLIHPIRRLPLRLQERWAEFVENLFGDEREPTFQELLRFLDKRVAVASNLYGRFATETAVIERRPMRPSNWEGAVSFRNQPSTSAIINYPAKPLGCPICNLGHDLEACTKFVSLPLMERQKILRDQKRCFKCMRSNHVSSVCRVMVKCNVAGCGRRHHTLMHREDAFDSGKLSNDVGRISACTSERNVQLGMVPVRLVGPRASVDTYAFLDNGSDMTVVRSDLCSQLGLEAIPKTLTVNTLHGTKTINSAEVNLTIQSLFSDTSLDVCRAYTVRELPIQSATAYYDPDTTQYPHLSDIKFGALADPTVGILVGCDVPEAHWILEQRIGRRREPYAEQTMLGWTLRGPSGADATRVKAVNYIGVAEVSIDDCFRNICEKKIPRPR